ncbi:MAG TPA: NB-ARC domain-containing protein [Chloroflexia bacterium]
MLNRWKLPEYVEEEEPADFAVKLRLALFENQEAAASHYGVDPGTLSKYESGGITPPLGYLASLSRLLLSERNQSNVSDHDRAAQQQFLVEQIKILVSFFPDKYKRQVPFSDWEHLCRAADKYESKHSDSSVRTARQAPPRRENRSEQSGDFAPVFQQVHGDYSTQILRADVTVTVPPIAIAPGSAPALPPLLLGRDEDLRHLKARLGIDVATDAPGPLHVLTTVRGWPGVGKTTLAAALAHDLDIEGTFPDGVLWASLGQHPSIFAELAAWGRALGHPELEGASTIEEASVRLAGLLRKQRRLLIVDDVWEAAHAVPFQVGGRGCALLLTTRLPVVAEAIAPTPDDIYLLDVLSETEALKLLRILAPRVVAADIDASKSLVRDLEGLPLAIQVAGRLLQSEAKLGFSVATLLEEIREGARLLEAQAPADRAEVSKETLPTVAALLQKSTDLLDTETRDCFAYLGELAPKPATFDEAALRAVWQVADPKPTIRVLVNRGLLEPLSAGRFWLHSLLVTHARTLLTS